jgi:hypothetical protein
MHYELENFKMVSVTPPAAIIDNASATTAEVDTKGFDIARFCIYIGATDIAMTALYLTESDASGSGHVEIAATDFSDATQTDIGGTALALPTDADDNKLIVINVDLRGRKRYLDLVATCGNGSAGTFLAAWCELLRGSELPATSAAHGCDTVIMI